MVDFPGRDVREIPNVLYLDGGVLGRWEGKRDGSQSIASSSSSFILDRNNFHVCAWRGVSERV